MSRITIPFSVGDISAFAKSLRSHLAESDHTPSHLELLNILARSAGHRNYQSLRAQAAAREVLAQPAPPPVPVDYVQVKRLVRYFDSNGRLANWPAKTSLQETCLWVLWSKLPSGQILNEIQLNQLIRNNHGFGDHALLRRELCDRGMVRRTADGRQYQRVERRPSAEGLALIHHLGEGGRQ